MGPFHPGESESDLYDARVNTDLSIMRPEQEALTHEHPLRERFCALRMRALYRSGRQPEALRAFQEHRSIVVDEVGLAPSSDLVALERLIVAQDPSV